MKHEREIAKGIESYLDGDDQNPYTDKARAQAWQRGWAEARNDAESARDRAFGEGEKAAQAGKPQSANPYGRGSDAGEEWDAGWEDADEEDWEDG
jgi:ribosome modulation factor